LNSRLHDRIAAVLSVMLLAGLGLFTYYLAALPDQTQPSKGRGTFDEPDYFVEGLTLTKMNAAGLPAFRLEAEGMRHQPDSDSTDFVKPRMVSLDPDRPRTVVVADRGTMAREGNETRLVGNVILTREATLQTESLRAETDYAVVLPEQDIVRTDRPVRIVRGVNVLTGVGMELDNDTQRFRLDSDVRAVLQARPPAATTPAR
jgi:lipopolysaccharide export system protein LptC